MAGRVPTSVLAARPAAERNDDWLVTKHSVRAEWMQALRRANDQPEQLQLKVPTA